MEDNRIISPQKIAFDENDTDRNLRPPSLNDFTGQDDIKESLSIAIEAARHRGDALDHCLFAGPPGLGKTTLAGIIAKEMGVNIHVTSGPVLEKASDLAGLLTSLQENDVLFIDEIHRLSRVVEEYLYPTPPWKISGSDIIKYRRSKPPRTYSKDPLRCWRSLI